LNQEAYLSCNIEGGDVKIKELGAVSIWDVRGLKGSGVCR